MLISQHYAEPGTIDISQQQLQSNNTSQCVTNERRKVTSQTTAIPINISPISYCTFTHLSKKPQIWWVWNTLLHKEHCSTCLLIGKRQIGWFHHTNNTRSNTPDVQLPFIFLPSQSLISTLAQNRLYLHRDVGFHNLLWFTVSTWMSSLAQNVLYPHRDVKTFFPFQLTQPFSICINIWKVIIFASVSRLAKQH